MQVTIDIPDSLPQERVQQRIKEIEESLREEANFLMSVKTIINNMSNQEALSSKQEWLGSMIGTAEITGDILSPTHGELVSWEVLSK